MDSQGQSSHEQGVPQEVYVARLASTQGRRWQGVAAGALPVFLTVLVLVALALVFLADRKDAQHRDRPLPRAAGRLGGAHAASGQHERRPLAPRISGHEGRSASAARRPAVTPPPAVAPTSMETPISGCPGCEDAGGDPAGVHVEARPNRSSSGGHLSSAEEEFGFEQ